MYYPYLSYGSREYPKEAEPNLKKHGASFIEAASVLADTLAAMLDDAPARTSVSRTTPKPDLTLL